MAKSSHILNFFIYFLFKNCYNNYSINPICATVKKGGINDKTNQSEDINGWLERSFMEFLIILVICLVLIIRIIDSRKDR